ncbi:MAG: class I SAM-dependent methyltransferase [Gaiellaceae bacterium]
MDKLDGERFGEHYFEALFAARTDPWAYESDYEVRKYAQTLSLLPPGAARATALEIGCAEGHFTERLARFVRSLVAADIAPTAIQRARKRCRHLDNVDFVQVDLFTDDLPGAFDLIVCSEILYFAPSEFVLRETASKLAKGLRTEGCLLAAHANVIGDDPQGAGFAWAVPFGAKRITEVISTTSALAFERELRCDLYRVQRYRRLGSADVPPVPHVENVERGRLTENLAQYAQGRDRRLRMAKLPFSPSRFHTLKKRRGAPWDSTGWEVLAQRIADLHDHLVNLLKPQSGERWLDVATGTGAVAIRAARAGADVTGLDLSPKMIENAKRLASEEAVAVRFDVGDAQELPYEEGSFDVVASSLGVESPPDHGAVARELARVCRVGGRLGIAVWRPDPEWDALRARFESGPGDPRCEGANWGREEYAEGLLRRAFELSFQESELRLSGESGEAVWRSSTRCGGHLKRFVDSLTANRREAFHRAYVDYYERHRTEDGVSVPKRYLIILGVRYRGGPSGE